MGAEGPTDDPEIIELRERQKRNFLATMFLSQGTPMILGGDEMGRTQGGNNNAWCQDTEISWFDWEIDERGAGLLEFTRRLITLRREHPVFRRRQFLHGTEEEGSGLPDAWWFRTDGRRMTKRDWESAHVVGMFLNGEEIAAPDERGNRVVDDSFLLLFNGSHDEIEFKLPPGRFGRRWTCELRTDDPEPSADVQVSAGELISVAALSLVVLRREN
jgi:glycogen operon protein